MSERDFKKPETREEFVRILTDAARKEVEARTLLSGKPAKATVSGTAKILGIHRDTLYSWLREFNVDFDEVAA
ncbi:MAG: hypothetical protein QXE06_07980, partial [Candidatus Bathyarchaeia archaeon]